MLRILRPLSSLIRMQRGAKAHLRGSARGQQVNWGGGPRARAGPRPSAAFPLPERPSHAARHFISARGMYRLTSRPREAQGTRTNSKCLRERGIGTRQMQSRPAFGLCCQRMGMVATRTHKHPGTMLTELRRKSAGKYEAAAFKVPPLARRLPTRLPHHPLHTVPWEFSARPSRWPYASGALVGVIQATTRAVACRVTFSPQGAHLAGPKRRIERDACQVL